MKRIEDSGEWNGFNFETPVITVTDISEFRQWLAVEFRLKVVTLTNIYDALRTKTINELQLANLNPGNIKHRAVQLSAWMEVCDVIVTLNTKPREEILSVGSLIGDGVSV